MASFSSSSPLLLFIDTNLDTHFSFTIDGDESIAQLKGRIISEHANCFPEIGNISIEAVKAKCGEFFYHLSHSMIIKYFFQIIKDGKLQIDIVPASSTVKSSSQTKTNTDACMDKRQLEKVEHLNCNGGHEASVQLDAKIKKRANSSDLKCIRKKKKEVSSNEENPVVDDSLQKISGTASENPPKEIFPEETISNSNNNGNHSNKSEMVQFVTSMKDSSDLKRKRKKKKKVTSNEEKPLVDESLQKINDTASENLPKEIFRTDTISNINDNGNNSNKSEILASFNGLSYHNNLQPIQSLVQAAVDDKQNRYEMFVEVPPAQTKLVNSTLGDATAEVMGKLPIFQKETINEAPDKLGDGNIVRLDNSIKEIAPIQKKKQRQVVRKIPISRFGSVLNNSNRDGLAPPTFNNSGSGSNRHDPDSGSRAKVDSNV